MRPFKIEYDYDAVPTIKKFSQDNRRIRAVMGPFGCIAGDTLIVTEKGLLPISDITQPMRVLSWNGRKCRYELSLSGGSFPKGMDYLYRVTTSQGEFAAAGHHRVLCEGNKYQSVENLQVGQGVSLCSEDRLRKFVSGEPSVLPEDVPRFSEIAADLMGSYAALARQYGRQLLLAGDGGQAFLPSQAYAQRLSGPFFRDAFLRMDDYGERLLKHTHLNQCAYPRQTDGYSSRSEHHTITGAGQISEQPFLHIVEFYRQCRQFLKKLISHCKEKVFFQSFCSSPSSLSDGNIISIKKEPIKRFYWDMQVLDTNNYISADGTIHHNSGKSSGCVIDIIRRAHNQNMNPNDGIKRLRCAVVRNTSKELKDTTIKTVKQWLPDHICGIWKESDLNYYINIFDGVEIEMMFRALDRPDQVKDLLSMELTMAWINEFREVPFQIFEALDGRHGRFPSKKEGGCSWHGIIMDTNPPDESSLYYKYFETVPDDPVEAKHLDKLRKIYKQPSGLSPKAENLKWLPGGRKYYENMARGKTEQYKRVYIHGQYGFIIDGKLVYESYNDNLHVAGSTLYPIRGLPLILGFDFALHPACLISQLTPRGQLLILDEMQGEGMGIKRFCIDVLLPLLSTKYAGMQVIGSGDPTGTSRAPTDETSCYDVLYSKEVGLRNIIAADTNALVPRIGSVETFLNKLVDGMPGIVISPNCSQLRAGFNGGYRRKRIPGMDNAFYQDPEKNPFSHLQDALQYICMFVLYRKEKEDRKDKILAQLRRGVQFNRPADSLAGY